MCRECAGSKGGAGNIRRSQTREHHTDRSGFARMPEIAASARPSILFRVFVVVPGKITIKNTGKEIGFLQRLFGWV